MDIVSEETVKPEEKNTEGTVTLDQFEEVWQGFYNHCWATMNSTKDQLGNAAQEKLIELDPEFDPVNKEADLALLEATIEENTPGEYKAYMAGVINGGLVIAKEMGVRLDFDIKGIADMLKVLNEQTEQHEFLNKEEEDAT